ncbi:hypothetical protein [Paenibacillus glycanilyticus]|uniref:hypothetical protein n=1 Tax=Paenibacillus glycanilyticus TaxID=126569 RepID=UPI00295EEE6A|nr:hypothetical protein [Paenibacillus glycanilyticus]
MSSSVGFKEGGSILKTVLTLLFISLFIVLLLVACPDPYQKVNVDGSAFIYGDHFNEKTTLTLKGNYNKKEYSFQGSLTIGDNIKLEHVLFASGYSLISYVRAERTSVGQVFFDPKSLRVSFEVTDPEIYKLITYQEYDGKSKLVVSSPAVNRDEAQRVNEELEQMKAPFDK